MVATPGDFSSQAQSQAETFRADVAKSYPADDPLLLQLQARYCQRSSTSWNPATKTCEQPTSCPAGTYHVSGVCAPCAPPCKNCTSGAHVCSTCGEDSLFAFSFVPASATCEGCGPKQYKNITTGACGVCHSTCSSCVGPGADECTRCISSQPLTANHTCPIRAGVMVSLRNVTVDEWDRERVFDTGTMRVVLHVHLSEAPSAPVRVTPAFTVGLSATQSMIGWAPTSFTFTPSSWNHSVVRRRGRVV